MIYKIVVKNDITTSRIYMDSQNALKIILKLYKSRPNRKIYE